MEHKINLDQRKNLFVTGVNDVISFDDSTIVVDTQLNILIVKGNELHVNKLNLENGELAIDGQINSLHYEEQNGVKSSFFSRIFK